MLCAQNVVLNSSGHFTTSDDSLLSQSSDSSRSIDSSRSNSRNVNGFRIMVTSSRVPHSLSNNDGQTMTRGYTDEADRILNYLVSSVPAPRVLNSQLSSRNTGSLTLYRNNTCAASFSPYTWSVFRAYTVLFVVSHPPLAGRKRSQQVNAHISTFFSCI